MKKLLIAFGLLIASTASADHLEVLHWTQVQPPQVDGFRVYWAREGSDFTTVDVGLVMQNTDGSYSYSILVPDGVNLDFKLIAYNIIGDSPFSNTICRKDGSPCAPTVPPVSPQLSHAAINGFRVVDANTDTTMINNFVNGNEFSPGCVAIEIKGNQYLRANKGSIKKLLDGVPGTLAPCENSYPFAWEDDAGVGQWNCAPTLNNIGQHTLTVIPYDGKDCSGPAGTPVSVSFGIGVLSEPSPILALTSGIFMLGYLAWRRHAY